MSWTTGSSAVGYIDLLDKLVKLATGTGVTVMAVNTGGTGYAVGDVVRVAGGTVSVTGSEAEGRVTVVSSGVITGIVVHEGGAYSSNPSSPNSVTTVTGGGSGASITLTLASNGWTEVRRSKQAASATVGAIGSGGTNGTQTVTLGTVGAVGVTTSATFSVTITGGAISAVLGVVAVGLYEVPPTNNVAVTGAGLVGATLNVTYATPTTQDQVCILQGTGGGSDTIFVGVRTYQAVNGANTAFNWSLHGFTAFNAGLTFDAQAGKSPGDPTVATGTLGAFVPLHNSGASFALDYWFSITPNRITGAIKIRNGTVTHYASLYMGFVNRFGSPSEWPYPLYISGCTTRVRALFNSTIATYVSSISELIAAAPTGGPGFYRRSDGTWVNITNSSISSDETSPSRVSQNDRVLFPTGAVNLSVQIIDGDDTITGTPSIANGGFVLVHETVTTLTVIETANLPGTPEKTLHPTPNTGASLRRLFPLTAIFAVNGPPVEKDIFGELDGGFWVSASDITTPLTSEDFIDVGTDRYRVFQSGNRALDYTYFALREK